MAHKELSKSKLIAFRQCPKRIWLEIHQPQLRQESNATQAIFRTGHQVGEIARNLYDPNAVGELIDLHKEGVGPAIVRTSTLLGGDVPIFEAGFSALGGMAFADVLLPTQTSEGPSWRMIEVKSSTSVKDYHKDDVAIQAYVARGSGVRLSAVSVAHIDTTWTYSGNCDFRGLLIEQDLSESAFAREEEVGKWIAAAHAVVGRDNPPEITTGLQCTEPFLCSFFGHCHQEEKPAEFPVAWLPRIQSKILKNFIGENGITDIRDVPDHLLNAKQRLVRDFTVSGECYFDSVGAKRDLAMHPLPAYFLDFETIQFGVPRWAGTRPFQAITFQFSVHHMDNQGTLSHQGFLDLTGSDPSIAFASNLVACCGTQGPVFVYNSGFEGRRIFELAERFADMKPALLAIRSRLVDLLPIAQSRYYHPDQRGSWSIKRVLPTICPDLRYEQLDGVQDGDMAMQAYIEAIAPETTQTRKQEIKEQLTAYCALDTFAMVRIWAKFASWDDAL